MADDLAGTPVRIEPDLHGSGGAGTSESRLVSGVSPDLSTTGYKDDQCSALLAAVGAEEDATKRELRIRS